MGEFSIEWEVVWSVVCVCNSDDCGRSTGCIVADNVSKEFVEIEAVESSFLFLIILNLLFFIKFLNQSTYRLSSSRTIVEFKLFRFGRRKIWLFVILRILLLKMLLLFLLQTW